MNTFPQGQNPTDEQPELPANVFLREDLLLHQREGNECFPFVVLEDTLNNKYYRLGDGEHQFIRALMSDPSVEAAIGCNQTESQLSDKQVIKFLGWLEQCGLTTSEMPEAKPASVPGTIFSKLFFFKIPLVDPDGFLDGLNDRASFLFSWKAALVSLAVGLIGLFLALANWSDFLESYENLFSPYRGAWLFVVWILLKVLHETSHGATCKRYGGYVPEAGAAMILFMPIAYVDVSSCWRFNSRWQRLHVTLAGVIVELFVAGLAMFVWVNCDSLIIKNAAADVVLLASVTSILFNLNPLLKFDGYFALADVTGVDNLYQYGQSYARYFGKRYVLGLEGAVPKLPQGNSRWVKLYGLAAATWRVVTVTGLLGTAAALFAGAGIVIAIIGFISFAVLPLVKLAGYLWSLYRAGTLDAGRLAMRVGLLAGTLGALLFVLPSEIRRTTPGIVEYDPPSVLRSNADGFVEEVLVADGERVSEGQPLIVLGNEELRIELETLEKSLAQAEQQMRSARWNNDSALLEEVRAEAIGLEQQVEELRLQFDGLVIRAPHSGKVVSRKIRGLVGTFVKRGEELGAVGNEDAKRVKISLSSWEASRAQEWASTPIRISVPGSWSWTSTLTRIEKRASEIPADPSLTAVGGGILAVREKEGADGPVLIEPRVNAYISLSPDRSRNLFSGQRCAVRLSCWRQSIGGAIVDYLVRS